MSLADQASLLLIPSGYKSQKLYSIFPTNGVGDFDFSRSGSATRIAQNGLITTVDSNVPRLNYPMIDGKVVGCPSLILEPQRTNLITHSQSFTSGWSFDDTTITENSTISPSGILNGSLLKGSTISSRHHIVTSVGPANVSATFSLFVKAKELKYIQIASANTVNQYVNFDTENGTIGTIGSSFSSAKIEDYGNGWYRISVISPNQYNGYYISLVSGLNVGWLESWVMPNNTDGLYIWGAQLEEGSHPTSYIKTSGSAVTRSEETANGSGDAATFNDSEGVLMAEISALANEAAFRQISINDSSTNDRVTLDFTSTDNQVRSFISVGGTSQALMTSSATVVDYNKAAVSYKVNNFALWVNGFKADTDTIGSVPIGLNNLNFDNGGGSNPFYGNTKQLQYYNSALTDSELEQLTSWTSFSDMANGQQYSIQ